MIIKKEKSEIESFLIDGANYQGECEAIYFPENEADIVEVFCTANRLKKRITIAGNGTGLTGARVPEGGIVISTSKLNRIIAINIQEKYAVVQTAVLLKDLQKELNNVGMLYPPDPTEQNCYIGATIATNASGAKSFKYGATRDYVLELKIILASGESLKLKRGENFSDGKLLKLITENGSQIEIELPAYSIPEVKHTAGYFVRKNMDAVDLFIGSEGTLGLITEAKIKLIDKPKNLISSILFFNKEDDALNFVDDARTESIKHRVAKDENNINARGLEFFDCFSLRSLEEDFKQIRKNYKAAIWFEQEVTVKSEDFIFNKWMELIEKHNADIENSWFAVDNSELEKLKRFRHTISTKAADEIVKNGFQKIGTDTAVPIEHFRKYYTEMKNEATKNSITYICYGHIGDCHLHFNMLPKNRNEFVVAKSLYAKFCRLAVNFGGTISAEHGIGKMKREYLLEMYGKKGIREMVSVKKKLDPNRLLGVGNIFDEKYLYA